MGTDRKVPQAPDIPQEPPPGSVVLDHADFAWQRRANSPDWYRTRGTHAWVWTELTNLRGPLTVVYTPTGDPASGRYVLHATSVMTAIRDDRLILSLAGPAGSVDVELNHADVTALAEDLNERLTGDPESPGDLRCRGCGAAIAGKLDFWVDDEDGVNCPGFARPTPHQPATEEEEPAAAPEPPALAVYLIERRSSASYGWERFDGIAYPDVASARVQVDQQPVELVWKDDEETGYTGRSFDKAGRAAWPWFRIVELTLAGTGPTGGAR